MKTILFSDMDGTLYKKGEVIHPKNTETLKKYQELGNTVVICTGRNYFEMLHDLRREDFIYDYLVLNNGGVIMDKEANILFEKKISFETGKAIIERIRSETGMFAFYCDGTKCRGRNDSMAIELSLEKDREEIPLIDFDDYKDASHYQIICFNQENEQIEISKQILEWIQERYSDEVECYFNEFYVDIVPKGCSKGQGIDELLNIVPNDYDKVLAIGDSFNDEPMIIRADIGTTFTYAPKSIQDQADLVVDYVYELLEKVM